MTTRTRFNAQTITKMLDDTNTLSLEDAKIIIRKLWTKSPTKTQQMLDKVKLNNTNIGPTPEPEKLFKVVATPGMNTRITAIVAFRGLTGAHLKEAKDWSEGSNYICPTGTYPSGVFGSNLTHIDAQNLVMKLRSHDPNSHVCTDIRPNDAPRTLPDWKPYY